MAWRGVRKTYGSSDRGSAAFVPGSDVPTA